MCDWVKSGANRVDPCIRPLIDVLKRGGAIPVASCCGHGRYSITVVVKFGNKFLAVAYREKTDSAAVILTHKRRFYRKDKQGYYYIPELDKEVFA